MELTIAMSFGIIFVIFAIYTTKKATTKSVKNEVFASDTDSFVTLVEQPFINLVSITVPTLDEFGVQLKDKSGKLKFHKEVPEQYKSTVETFKKFKTRPR
jgi:hypothetical protein